MQERRVSVQESLSESIKRVKTFASERLQEKNNPELDGMVQIAKLNFLVLLSLPL